MAVAATISTAAAQVSLRVRVVDDATNAPLTGADVELVGRGRVATDRAGEAQFRNLERGRHVIVVQLLGYDTFEDAALVQRDTLITVRLTIAPVRLDSIVVAPRHVTVRGTVKGADTRRGVSAAEVLIGGRAGSANAVGYFRIKDVPAGTELPVEVVGLGYLPYRAALTANRDTSIAITLHVDPIAQRMIAERIKRLELRLRPVPYAMRQFRREDILRHAGGSLAMALHFSGIAVNVRCVVIDDIPRMQGVGPAMLDAYLAEEIERVESIPRLGMLRVYTVRYVRSRMAAKPALVPIVSGICQ